MVDLEKIYFQVDETGKFFKLKRKELTKEIKSSLMYFEKECNKVNRKSIKQEEEIENLIQNSNNLKQELDSLSDINKTQKEDIKKLELSVDDKSKKIDKLNSRYNLVSSFLNAKPKQNDKMEYFKKLIFSDFIEFANNESSLEEEAKALLILQDVEKRLQNIITFPSIYSKNIVAVGGGFSAGKSEFLNSLFIDSTIKLPVGINPVTAIPTYITKGEKNIIKGYSYKGGIVELSANIYKELSHDFIKSLGFNLKDIAPIMAIETPMKSYENICFIDTPGYNPANTGYTDEDTDTSKEYLEHSNTLLWTIGIDTNGTIPASDLEFLETINLTDKKIYIIANKADLRSQDDIEDILDIFEEILEEYDIEYEGISAFSSINKEEIAYRNISLFDFLDEANNPVEIQTSILSELKEVFKMYRTAINEQISWTKNIQSHLKSLDLDLLEYGVDIDENEKASVRMETIKKIFDNKTLNKQLKVLNKLEEKILQSTIDIFGSLQVS